MLLSMDKDVFGTYEYEELAYIIPESYHMLDFYFCIVLYSCIALYSCIIMLREGTPLPAMDMGCLSCLLNLHTTSLRVLAGFDSLQGPGRQAAFEGLMDERFINYARAEKIMAVLDAWAGGHGGSYPLGLQGRPTPWGCF